MGRFATTSFSATQRCYIVATVFQVVTTLFQHCNAGLRLKLSLRIVPRNITLSLFFRNSFQLLFIEYIGTLKVILHGTIRKDDF